MADYIKKTKIICTIGPACNTEEMLLKMILAGMNVCRLNLSHGGKESFVPIIERIKNARQSSNIPVAILLDTRGPEVRVRKFADDKAVLKRGEKVTLKFGDFVGDSKNIPITYSRLYEDLSKDSCILLDDGALELKVVEIQGEDIICEVIIGGIIKNNKGINIPGVSLNLPALGEKDKEDIIAGIENGIDFVAASFVRSIEDVEFIRDFLNANGGQHVAIISKIENQQGIDNLDGIIDMSDGIMVARGDLGVEMEKERIPLMQKMVIKKCNAKAVPVITATQMLESMYNSPTPTRAELSDIANAIIDGTDVIMLSGETAAGKYPLLAVKQMAKSAVETEKALDYAPKTSMLGGLSDSEAESIANAVSYAACNTAHCLNAAAIIVPTHGGKTAKLISSYHPKCAIIATTTNYFVQRQLQLYWGVTPILADVVDSMDVLFYHSIDMAKKNKFIDTGEIVVIPAGVPLGGTHKTNIMKVMDVK